VQNGLDAADSFCGVIYHVINRDNYRKDLFENPSKAEAFERTLFGACNRCGWKES